MDPLSTLPPPILLAMVKEVTDLASLRALRSASPAVASLMRESGLASEITEAVISSSLPRDTQYVVRTLALVAWGAPSFLNTYVSSWDGLRDLVADDGISQATGPGSKPLSAEMPASVIFRVLALARLVHSTAHRALHALIRRCLELQPRQPVDTSWSYRRHQFYNMVTRSFQAPPVPLWEWVQMDTNGATARPSLIEEQRALSGVWRVYLHATLASAPTPSSLRDELRASSPTAFWHQLLPPHKVQLEYVQTMAECITQLRPARDTFLPLSPLTISGREPWNCCMETPPSRAGEWKQGAEEFNRESPGAFFFRTLTVYHWSPLRCADFSLFRKFGFGVWDLKRMVALGFMYDDRICKERFGGKSRPAEQSNFFTWWSILTEDEAASLETVQRAQIG